MFSKDDRKLNHLILIFFSDNFDTFLLLINFAKNMKILRSRTVCNIMLVLSGLLKDLRLKFLEKKIARN